MSAARGVGPCVVVALCVGLGCESPPEPGEREFVFQTPVAVWQSAQGGARGVWLAEAGGGRGFALLSATLADGAEGILALERRGDDWGAAVPFTRPAGASAESVGSVGTWPAPILVSVAQGPSGAWVVARTFAGTAWSAAVALSTAGAEQTLFARAAEVNLLDESSRPARFEVVYAVRSSVCEEGAELRVRTSDARPLLASGDAPTWGAARPITVACGLRGLAAATTADALAVAWVGGSPGVGAAASDLFATIGRGEARAFDAPSVVQRGVNRSLGAASLGGGRFLLAWSMGGAREDAGSAGLQRAAWARFDAAQRAWSRVDTGWFFSRVGPVLGGDGAGEALALGGDGDFSGAQLALRRWTEAAPIRTRSTVGSPLGAVRSSAWLRMRDGSVEVIWIEDAPQGGAQRVMWTRGVRVVSSDAGV